MDEGRPPKSLTRRQREVLDFIRSFLDSQGYPPTVREIAAGTGMSSPRGASKHLLALARKGWILQKPGLSRGIALSPPLREPKPVPEAFNRQADAVPILGSVPAGPLDLAVEDREGEIALDSDLGGPGSYLLRVTGESMTGDNILPGDLAMVRVQAEAEDGDLVIAMVGDEATLKRFRRRGGSVSLEPSNPSYPAIPLHEGSENTRILGKDKAIIRILDRR